MPRFTILFMILGGALVALLFDLRDLAAGLMIIGLIFSIYLRSIYDRREELLVEYANHGADLSYANAVYDGIVLAQKGFVVQVPSNELDSQPWYWVGRRIEDPFSGGKQFVPFYRVTNQGLEALQLLDDAGGYAS
jgi:hypothetical protein